MCFSSAPLFTPQYFGSLQKKIILVTQDRNQSGRRLVQINSRSILAIMAGRKGGDNRFAALSQDPRYRLPSKKHTKATVDKRFSHHLRNDDADFNRKSKVDKYGRRISKSDQDVSKEEGNQSDSDEEDEVGDALDESLNDRLQKGRQRREIASASSSDDSEEEGDVSTKVSVTRTGSRPSAPRDAARTGFSSSSSEEESSSDEEDEEEGDADEDDADTQAEVPLGEVSSRIAVVNLDWDNIRAQDIMAVAKSFVDADGRIESVAIYPSEYGKEKLEREELEGPPKEIFHVPALKQQTASDVDSQESAAEDDEEDEVAIKSRIQSQNTSQGEEFNPAQLRKYQLDRLKYFYAVVTCTSSDTAQSIYTNLDGREYLSSANFFDLRFIPEEVSFEADKPRETCKALPQGYKPNEFVTEALTHSKVKLTWDAEDTARKEVQKRAFSRAELEEEDLKAYIGGDSTSESEAEPITTNKDDKTQADKTNVKVDKKAAERQRMRSLLGLSTEKESKSKKTDGPVGDMQITFTSGLSSIPDGGRGRDGVFENSPPRDETTRERYVRKERERKAKRKEKAKAKRDGDAGEDDGPVSINEIVDEAADTQPGKDDPFDDPFFKDEDPDKKISKTQKEKIQKKDRIARREAKQAELARSEAERKKLEALMHDESRRDGKGDEMKHFDMKEIVKTAKLQEKQNKKNKNKNKRAEEDKINTDGGDVVETSDPRFSKLFESHEFAIDPSNPRYMKTEGMQKLLEEGRKRRRDGEGHIENERKKAKKTADVEDRNMTDTQKLLAKVKARAKTNK